MYYGLQSLCELRAVLLYYQYLLLIFTTRIYTSDTQCGNKKHMNTTHLEPDISLLADSIHARACKPI